MAPKGLYVKEMLTGLDVYTDCHNSGKLDETCLPLVQLAVLRDIAYRRMIRPAL